MAARPETSKVDPPAAPATPAAAPVEPVEPAAVEPVAPVEPAGPRRLGPRLDLVLRVLGAVTVALVAVEAAVLEAFLVPLHVGRWPVPLAPVLAAVGNLLLPKMIVTVARRRSAAVLPPLLWLVVVLVFAAPRGEGDLVVPGTWAGLLFLFTGAITGAFGAASSMLGSWRPSAALAAAAGTPRKAPPRG